MAWVPSNPERRASIVSMLEANPHILNGINRVGLQLWHVTSTGQLTYTTEYSTIPNDAEVSAFVEYFHSKNIQVLATIYNATTQWDWQMFNDALNNSDTLAQASFELVQKFGLDGIDIDLELIAIPTTDYQTNYAAMLQKLSNKLKAAGKVLTVDAFFSDCDNVPNQAWWGDWVNYVNHIHAMGYESMFEGSTQGFWCTSQSNPFKYSSQQNAGVAFGFRPDQISMAMPGTLSSWGSGGVGTTPKDHIQEVLNLSSPASIAMWDLALSDGNWKASDTWAKAAEVKAIGTPIVPTQGTLSLNSSSFIKASQQVFQTNSSSYSILKSDLGKNLKVYDIEGRELGSFQMKNEGEIKLPGSALQIKILKIN